MAAPALPAGPVPGGRHSPPGHVRRSAPLPAGTHALGTRLHSAPSRPRPPRAQPAASPAASPASTPAVDVAIVGGGIIGLATALALLRHPARPRVALIEAESSTAGGGSDTPTPHPPLPFGGRATGAGQGYLWLAHRDPASPLWGAAVASKALWVEWVGGVGGGGGGGGDAGTGGAWAGAQHRATGSLLQIGRAHV